MSDRDALADLLGELGEAVMESVGTNDPLTTTDTADAILTSDWLAAHDRDLIGRAHAPIKALADEWERMRLPTEAGRNALATATHDLRAALDLAAVAEYEQRIRAEAVTASRTEIATSLRELGYHHAAAWLDGDNADRADALGGDDR